MSSRGWCHHRADARSMITPSIEIKVFTFDGRRRESCEERACGDVVTHWSKLPRVLQLGLLVLLAG
jgi:hypothetical protein